MNKVLPASLVSLVAICALAFPANAATIEVTTTLGTPDATDAFCGLNEAIQAANADLDYSGCVRQDGGSADTIVLGNLTYDTAEILAVTSDITVVGAGANDTVIRLGAPGYGFWTQALGGFEPTLILQALRIEGDAGPSPVTCVRAGAGTTLLEGVALLGCRDGVDIFPNAHAEAQDSWFVWSSESGVDSLGWFTMTGGGVLQNGEAGVLLRDGSSALVDDAYFEDCRDGIEIHASAQAELTDSWFVANRESGIDSLGSFTMTGGGARDNEASGIVVGAGGGAEIADAELSDNFDAGLGGGGLRIVSTSDFLSQVLLTRVQITGNSCTGNGGGIYNFGGLLNIVDSTIEYNTCTDAPEEGSPSAGGGIWGGGGSGTQSVTTVQHSRVAWNRAPRGGGIALANDVSGRLDFSFSTLANNQADFEGGGIYDRGQSDFWTSTISGNTSETLGGGIYKESFGELHVSQTSIASNIALNGGGGVFVEVTGNPFIRDSIVANNWAPPGTGVDINAVSVVAVGITLGSNVLVSDDDGAVGAIDPLVVAADPGLGPLTEINGHWVHPLLADSPAIDQMDVALTDPDQLGTPRNIDGDDNGSQLGDWGAVEYDPAADNQTFVVAEQQLVVDPTLESGAAGWQGSYGVSLISSTAQAQSGTRSLFVSQRNLGTWQGAVYDLLGAAQPGARYEAEISVRLQSASSEPILLTRRAECLDGNPLYQTVAVGTGYSQTWTKLEGTLTVPSCELASLIVYVEGPAQGVSFFVDDASLFREYLVPSQGSPTLSGNFVLQTDWGSGYCVDLVVTNPQAQATIDWSASFSLNGAVISGVWNLGLAQSGGMATVTPLDAWSRQIAAGQSSHSLGFCAARPSGGNALPSSLSVLGAF